MYTYIPVNVMLITILHLCCVSMLTLLILSSFFFNVFCVRRLVMAGGVVSNIVDNHVVSWPSGVCDDPSKILQNVYLG